MTEQLYYTDPHLASFEARVLQQKPEGDRWAVILDRTAFYPEGGGQPADRGMLNDLPVVDVQKRGQEICHYLAKPLGESGVVEGMTVEGSIDRERRLECRGHVIAAREVGLPGRDKRFAWRCASADCSARRSARCDRRRSSS